MPSFYRLKPGLAQNLSYETPVPSIPVGEFCYSGAAANGCSSVSLLRLQWKQGLCDLGRWANRMGVFLQESAGLLADAQRELPVLL
jgi:hypothetical protein